MRRAADQLMRRSPVIALAVAVAQTASTTLAWSNWTMEARLLRTYNRWLLAEAGYRRHTHLSAAVGMTLIGMLLWLRAIRLAFARGDIKE